MELKPITRQEKIIAGQDLTPITRLEKFLKEYGGSGGGVSPEEVAAIVKAPNIRLYAGWVSEKKRANYNADGGAGSCVCFNG